MPQNKILYKQSPSVVCFVFERLIWNIIRAIVEFAWYIYLVECPCAFSQLRAICKCSAFFWSSCVFFIFSCKSRIFYLSLEKCNVLVLHFYTMFFLRHSEAGQWEWSTKNKTKAQNAICLCSSNAREKLNKSHLLVQDVLPLSMCKGNRWITSEATGKKRKWTISIYFAFFLIWMSFYTSSSEALWIGIAFFEVNFAVVIHSIFKISISVVDNRP